MVGGQINDDPQRSISEKSHQAKEDQTGDKSRLPKGVGDPNDARADD